MISKQNFLIFSLHYRANRTPCERWNWRKWKNKTRTEIGENERSEYVPCLSTEHYRINIIKSIDKSIWNFIASVVEHAHIKFNVVPSRFLLCVLALAFSLSIVCHFLRCSAVSVLVAVCSSLCINRSHYVCSFVHTQNRFLQFADNNSVENDDDVTTKTAQNNSKSISNTLAVTVQRLSGFSIDGVYSYTVQITHSMNCMM